MSEKSHGQRSLAGYSPWGRKESDKTEQLNTHTHTHTHTHWSQRNKDEFRGQILRTVSLRNNQLNNLCQRKQNSWKRGKEFKTRITNMLEELREDIGNIK